MASAFDVLCLELFAKLVKGVCSLVVRVSPRFSAHRTSHRHAGQSHDDAPQASPYSCHGPDLFKFGGGSCREQAVWLPASEHPLPPLTILDGCLSSLSTIIRCLDRKTIAHSKDKQKAKSRSLDFILIPGDKQTPSAPSHPQTRLPSCLRPQ